MMRPASCRRRVLALLGGLLALPSASAAQSDPEATRQALIQEAAAAAQAGQHATAIAFARRALEIRASPSLHFLLAREELAVSLPLAAHDHATLCLEQVRADAAVADRDALTARCEALQREAEGSLARLTVRSPSPRVAGLRVTVDGLPLEDAQLDTMLRRMPGPVEVRADAEGRVALLLRRSLAAGAHELIALELELAAPPPVPPPRRRERPPARSPSYAGPWSFAALALAAAATSGIVGGLALSARAERDARCPSPAACDLSASTAADARYRDLATAANVGLTAFGVFAGAALTWWLVLRFGNAAPRTTTSLQPFTLRW